MGSEMCIRDSFETRDGVRWDDANYYEIQSMFNEMHAGTDLRYWGMY